MIKKIIIIGNGIAGTTAALTLRESGFKGEVTLISEEPYPLYYRTRLPELISENVDLAKLTVTDLKKHENLGISLKLGERVCSIDRERDIVQTGGGVKSDFDALVLATGSEPFVPPLPGAKELKGIFCLKKYEDALSIRDWAKGKKHAVCLGGGLLGLESAFYLNRLGLTVEVVEFMNRLLPRQLDENSAAILQAVLESKGIKFHLGMKARQFHGDGIIRSLEIEGKGEMSTDMCIISAGVRPRSELMNSAGLKCERGLIVDENGLTSRPRIYAAGEHIQFNQQTWGTWLAARHWGKRIGEVLAGKITPFTPPPEVFRLKVTGIDLLSLGNTDLEGNGALAGCLKAHILLENIATGKYLKIIEEAGIVVGAISLGIPEKARFIESAVKERRAFTSFLSESGLS